MKKNVIKTMLLTAFIVISGVVMADVNKSFGLQPNDTSASPYNYLGREYPKAWIKFISGSGNALLVLQKDYGNIKKTVSERTKNVYTNAEYTEHYDKFGSGNYRFIVMNTGSDNIYGEYVLYSSDSY